MAQQGDTCGKDRQIYLLEMISRVRAAPSSRRKRTMACGVVASISPDSTAARSQRITAAASATWWRVISTLAMDKHPFLENAR